MSIREWILNMYTSYGESATTRNILYQNTTLVIFVYVLLCFRFWDPEAFHQVEVDREPLNHRSDKMSQTLVDIFEVERTFF